MGDCPAICTTRREYSTREKLGKKRGKTEAVRNFLLNGRLEEQKGKLKKWAGPAPQRVPPSVEASIPSDPRSFTETGCDNSRRREFNRLNIVTTIIANHRKCDLNSYKRKLQFTGPANHT